MEEIKIPFNKPFRAPNEQQYIHEVLTSGRMAGNGPFTLMVQTMIEQRYAFKRCFLTNSCTAALEMSAILADIGPGDEVIMPSFGFVTTATAFALRGAKLTFCDSSEKHPNLDAEHIKPLITPDTKAVVVIHYGGVGCDIQPILDLCREHNLLLIEDAAQCIDSFYDGKPLGSFGDMATFSFHETKNINTGQGGMLVVNNEKLLDRAAVIWDKGTNREAFVAGKVDFYEWTDLGSSFLPSEIIPAILKAQLEALPDVQAKRKHLWDLYQKTLINLNNFEQFPIPEKADHNAHLFAVLCRSKDIRDEIIRHLKFHGIEAVFHYQPLHKSAYYRKRYATSSLPHADRFSDCLLRLPLHDDLNESQVKFICNTLIEYDKR